MFTYACLNRVREENLQTVFLLRMLDWCFVCLFCCVVVFVVCSFRFGCFYSWGWVRVAAMSFDSCVNSVGCFCYWFLNVVCVIGQ